MFPITPTQEEPDSRAQSGYSVPSLLVKGLGRPIGPILGVPGILVCFGFLFRVFDGLLHLLEHRPAEYRD